MTKKDLKAIHDTLAAALDRKRYRKIDFFKPYKKQIEFFDLSLTMRERLLMAGNQLGKTYAGAAEMTYHLTGEYPDWWMGKRYDRPVAAWACGESSTLVRDVQQRLLCGKAGVTAAHGTGMIPRKAFADKPSLARGVTDAYDTIQVHHKSGGISTLSFKSYEQGRTKFQGDSIDIIWLDEEPDEDIYTECLTRTSATKGIVFMTFTPLKGMSEVVKRFRQEHSPDRATVIMTIYDAEHYTPEEREKIIAGYPKHQRQARAMGVPLLGSGAVFEFAEDAISEAAIQSVPLHWGKLWAVDFGIAHPFAAVLLAWDKDFDVIHILHTIRVKDQRPLEHSHNIKSVAGMVPVAWPQDGHAREKGSGESLAKSYKKHGLLMLPHHATFPDGSYSREAAILEMQERMATGRLKVARHLADWFEEFRSYHRKDGMIVEIDDDLISATQKGIAQIRSAKPVPLGAVRPNFNRAQNNGMARDVDFPLN